MKELKKAVEDLKGEVRELKELIELLSDEKKNQNNSKLPEGWKVITGAAKEG